MKAAFLTLLRMALAPRNAGIVACLSAAACSMPQLVDPPNLLSRPPNFSEMPKEQSSDRVSLAAVESVGTAGGDLAPADSINQAEIAHATELGAGDSNSSEVAYVEKAIAPPPAPAGMLRGQSTIYGLDLSDDDGLVCAGRPAPGTKSLQMGEMVSVACNDGSWGKVWINGRDKAGFVTATLSIENRASKQVQIVERQ